MNEEAFIIFFQDNCIKSTIFETKTIMKKQIFSFCIFLLLFSCAQNNTWEKTQQQGTISAYRDFIENNPESKHIAEAQSALDSLLFIKDTNDWALAIRLDNIAEYKKYLEENPDGQFIDLAKRKIQLSEFKEEQEKDWEKALQKNTVFVYEEFIKNYQEGELVDEARKKLFQLKDRYFFIKYKDPIEFFEILKTKDSSFEDITNFFAPDSCIYNASVFYPPYSLSAMSKKDYNDFTGIENLFGETVFIEDLYNEETHDLILQEESETTTIFFFKAKGIGDNEYKFIWSKINNKYRITSFFIWWEGDY